MPPLRAALQLSSHEFRVVGNAFDRVRCTDETSKKINLVFSVHGLPFQGPLTTNSLRESSTKTSLVHARRVKKHPRPKWMFTTGLLCVAANEGDKEDHPLVCFFLKRACFFESFGGGVTVRAGQVDAVGAVAPRELLERRTEPLHYLSA